jgi:hypothetical protein
LAPASRILYQLRAQLIVSVLAFIAMSGVGEIHHVYRNMILEIQYGSSGFTVAVLSVAALSVFIWFSSIMVLLPMSASREPSSSLRFVELLHWWRYRGFFRSDFRDESALSLWTAAIVGAVSILPLLGLALGLWLAIPKTPEGALRSPGEELLTPDQTGPQNRTELPFTERS